MKISCSNIKKFLIFSRGKAFRLFRKKDPPAYKKILTFQETELSDIPRNGTPPQKKLLLFHDTEHSYITRSNFPSMKNIKNPL